jgi:hypothetical protein
MSSADAPSDPILWAAVTDDLWVASRGGDFVGTVERIENRFVAVDGRGAPVGVNGSLSGAQFRLEARPTGRTQRGPSLVSRLRRPRVRRTSRAAA